MSAVGVGIGGIVGVGSAAWAALAAPLVLAAAAAAAFTAGGEALDDLFDPETGRLKPPGRPLAPRPPTLRAGPVFPVSPFARRPPLAPVLQPPAPAIVAG